MEELTQMDMGSHSKTLNKSRYKGKWKKKHQGYNKEDGYYPLTREGQVTISRLRTGHNRLKQHMSSKLKLGTTDMWSRQNVSIPSTANVYGSVRTDMAITRTNCMERPVNSDRQLPFSNVY
jgi:hypothetical protein